MTTFDFTTDGLTAALRVLGDTANAVADTLAAGGHRGKPGCETSCPVAEFMGEHYLYPEFTVSVLAEPPDGAIFVEVYRNADGAKFEVDVPQPVAEFVRRFDEGSHYVDLRRIPGEVEAVSS